MSAPLESVVREPVRPGLRGVFDVHDMRMLLLGFVTSRTGDFLYSVALVVFIAESTGSAAWVGAAALVRLLPVAVLSPVAGVLSARLPMRRLLVLCDLGQAVGMLALAAVVAVDGAPVLALALAGLSSALATPSFPVLTAVTPRLVAEHQLAATNTFISTVENLALILGPAVGGLLLLVGPPSVPIALNALTFLASAAFTAAVTFAGSPGSGDADTERPESFFGQLGEGFRATVADREVALLVVFTSAVTFVYGFELVYLVFVADEKLGIGVEGIGYLNAAMGVGGAAGAFLTNRLADSPRLRMVLVLTLLGCGLPLGLLAVVSQPWVAYVLLGVEGLASIALDVVVVTALQRMVRPDLLGRVSSIMDSLTITAILLGNVAAVVLLAATDLTVSLVVVGAFLPVLALALLPFLGDLERRASGGRAQLAPAVAALRASHLLVGAGPTVVERLAGLASTERLPSGTVVMQEGEEASEVVVLAQGRLDVSVAGQRINVVDAPGYVGEIGLLRGSRRTATVTAASDCVVHRIPGPDFLAAVTGGLPVPLQTEMSVRLERSGPA
ncbi:MAG: MFS transporter [Spirochaetaceae bacterium]|nr:MFS transporter [Spirochaetaceae bacterium]